MLPTGRAVVLGHGLGRGVRHRFGGGVGDRTVGGLSRDLTSGQNQQGCQQKSHGSKAFGFYSKAPFKVFHARLWENRPIKGIGNPVYPIRQ